MEPNLGQSPRSRQHDDWRGARGLVIEGHVVARRTGTSRPAQAPTEPPAPRWGAALDAAAALAPSSPHLARIALPAGLALVAFVAFALSPGGAERHGAAEPTVRVAAAPVIR
jgi:hypothetical protein